MSWTAPLSLVAQNLLSALIARREVLGISQRALAKRLGCTQRQVWNWENGRGQPTLGWLILWGRALDMHFRPVVVDHNRRAPPKWRKPAPVRSIDKDRFAEAMRGKSYGDRSLYRSRKMRLPDAATAMAAE